MAKRSSPATSLAEMTATISVPVADLPPGYISQNLGGPITERQARALRRLVNALDSEQATATRRGGPPQRVTPDNNMGGVRWLLDRLADEYREPEE